ncbi:hypothetical protein DFP72DRAFT_860761 [Ephemerocybe angulata]|uniref:Uncharacterized protein n=1 Tax=Ephemerocybe angulata TaxID=980116 RepID=A0A8H6H980_9AGAR|nr:hypothetical protein DFP72DRAFT_860761 [Tulosesus angulatus]
MVYCTFIEVDSAPSTPKIADCDEQGLFPASSFLTTCPCHCTARQTDMICDRLHTTWCPMGRNSGFERTVRETYNLWIRARGERKGTSLLQKTVLHKNNMIPEKAQGIHNPHHHRSGFHTAMSAPENEDLGRARNTQKERGGPQAPSNQDSHRRRASSSSHDVHRRKCPMKGGWIASKRGTEISQSTCVPVEAGSEWMANRVSMNDDALFRSLTPSICLNGSSDDDAGLSNDRLAAIAMNMTTVGWMNVLIWEKLVLGPYRFTPTFPHNLTPPRFNGHPSTSASADRLNTQMNMITLEKSPRTGSWTWSITVRAAAGITTLGSSPALGGDLEPTIPVPTRRLLLFVFNSMHRISKQFAASGTRARLWLWLGLAKITLAVDVRGPQRVYRGSHDREPMYSMCKPNNPPREDVLGIASERRALPMPNYVCARWPLVIYQPPVASATIDCLAPALGQRKSFCDVRGLQIHWRECTLHLTHRNRYEYGDYKPDAHAYTGERPWRRYLGIGALGLLCKQGEPLDTLTEDRRLLGGRRRCFTRMTAQVQLTGDPVYFYPPLARTSIPAPTVSRNSPTNNPSQPERRTASSTVDASRKRENMTTKLCVGETGYGERDLESRGATNAARNGLEVLEVGIDGQGAGGRLWISMGNRTEVFVGVQSDADLSYSPLLLLIVV